MEKKQNRRIDFLLHLLLKIARDKIFERLQKTQRGKSSYQQCEINKRHRTAPKMSPLIIYWLIRSNAWKIKPSVSSRNDPYIVKKQLDNCHCHLRCSSCDVCVHMYSCTCMDYLIHSTVCKHIHLVNTYQPSDINSHFEHEQSSVLSSNSEEDALSKENNESLLSGASGNDCEEPPLQEESTSSIIADMPKVDTCSVNYFSSQLIGKVAAEVEKLQENATETCKKIEVAVKHSNNTNIIKSAQKHLNTA